MSKADFAHAFARAVGASPRCLRPGSVTSMNFRAWRPRDMRLDTSRVEAVLGEKMPALADEIVLVAEEYRAEI